MKPAPFAYVRAASLDQTFDLLARHVDQARVLAGGQSLIPTLNLRWAEADRRGMPPLGRRHGDHGMIGVAVHVPWSPSSRNTGAYPARLGKVN